MTHAATPPRPGVIAPGWCRQALFLDLERTFDYPGPMRTWERHDPDRHRPIAAPLDRCAELLGVDLATNQRIAANVEPYIRADGTASGAQCSSSGNWIPTPSALGGTAATSPADARGTPAHDAHTDHAWRRPVERRSAGLT